MNQFIRFIIFRLLSLIPTIFGLLLLTFILSHVIPGNPALILGGPEVVDNPQELHLLDAELGLNKPLYVQFYIYLVQLAHLNLGYSYTQSVSVNYEIAQRAPLTIELAFFTMLIGLPIAIYAGIYSALHANKAGDHAVRTITLFGVSMPVYWLGIVLILLFYVYLGIAPAPFGTLSPLLTPPPTITGATVLDSLITGHFLDFINSLWHIILPAFVLSLFIIAVVGRVIRTSMLDVVNKDYMRTAFAVGLPRNILINRYALKNALLPALTVTAINMGALMGGVVLTETVFSWPGLGWYLFHSIGVLDYTSVMAVVLFSGLVFVIINFIADLLYAIIDPRIRY